MIKLLIIGLGGFLGAVSRYLVAGWVQRLHNGTFPFGTLAVNVIGCLLIGAAMALVQDRPLLAPNARLFFMIGLLGAFTTFSAFGCETVELLHDAQYLPALANAAANLLLGVGAVVLGRLILKSVFT